jgi:hypothetical protein
MIRFQIFITTNSTSAASGNMVNPAVTPTYIGLGKPLAAFAGETIPSGRQMTNGEPSSKPNINGARLRFWG